MAMTPLSLGKSAESQKLWPASQARHEASRPGPVLIRADEVVDMLGAS